MSVKTIVIETLCHHEHIGSLQDEMDRRHFWIAPPFGGETGVICIDPNDANLSRGRRFICFWTGTKAEYRRACPVGTRVVVEDRPEFRKRLEDYYRDLERRRLRSEIKRLRALLKRTRHSFNILG